MKTDNPICQAHGFEACPNCMRQTKDLKMETEKYRRKPSSEFENLCGHILKDGNDVFFCGYCVEEKTLNLEAENDSLKLRHQELEERVGNLGAERIRLLEENEKLKALCDELSDALERQLQSCSYPAVKCSVCSVAVKVLEKYKAHLEGEKQK